MSERIHLIEAGGRGGVFQHSIALAAALSNAGRTVVLHTASDYEVSIDGITYCGCFRWFRSSGSRIARQAGTVMRLMLRTLPHLARTVRPGELAYVQGSFAMTPEIIRALRVAGATVVCSPHNIFARSGAPGASRALRSALTRSDRILVYSATDRKRLAEDGLNAGLVPLVQWVPPVRKELADRWRAELGAGNRPLALLPGQVRSDKNPDLLVRAVALLPDWAGAVVGQDLGAGPELDYLVEALEARVSTRYAYLDMDDFVALVSVADVVVAPYAVASQSGVLSVARALGVPTVVTPTGGLVEQATVVADSFEPADLAEAIKLAQGRGGSEIRNDEVAACYLAEFMLATGSSAKH